MTVNQECYNLMIAMKSLARMLLSLILCGLLSFAVTPIKAALPQQSAPPELSSGTYIAANGGCDPSFVPCVEDPHGAPGSAILEAIASGASPIVIIGEYRIGDEPIDISVDTEIYGFETATLMYDGNNNEAMFLVNKSFSLHDLRVEGNHLRDFAHINTSLPVYFHHTTIKNSFNVLIIDVHDADVKVEFNHITNNSGLVVKQNQPSTTGSLIVEGNNLIDNSTPVQLVCKGPNSVDHNFWGDDQTPQSNAPDCDFDPNKILGAPAALNASGHGVIGDRVKFAGSEYESSDKRLRLSSATSGSELVYMDHGPDIVPTFNKTAPVIPTCSHSYYFFIPKGASAPAEVEAHITYDDACQQTIEAEPFCATPNQASYPLLWFDPALSDTAGWDFVGAGAVPVSCDIDDNSISMTLSANGLPNIIDHLDGAPFLIGFPYISGETLPTVNISYVSHKVTLSWKTEGEDPEIHFMAERAKNPSGPWTKVGSLPGQGKPMEGADYQLIDSNGLEYATTYHYRVSVLNQNNERVQLLPVIDTITTGPAPTSPPTPTSTHTPTKTLHPYPLSSLYRTATSAYNWNLNRFVSTPTTSFLTQTYVANLTRTPSTTTSAVTPTPRFTQTKLSLSPTPTETPTLAQTSTAAYLGEARQLISSPRYSRHTYWAIALGSLATFCLTGLAVFLLRKRH